MKLDEVLYVLALVACALLATATEHCGGTADPAPTDDAAPDASPAFRTCYAPSTPLRAYACGTEANCSTCPAGCTPADAFDAGPGECKP